MCKCDPGIRTPYCGKGNCQWPKEDNAEVNAKILPHDVRGCLESIKTMIKEPNIKVILISELEKIIDKSVSKLNYPKEALPYFDTTLKIKRHFPIYLSDHIFKIDFLEIVDDNTAIELTCVKGTLYNTSPYSFTSIYDSKIKEFSRNTITNIAREFDSTDSGDISMIIGPRGSFKTTLSLKVVDNIINPYKENEKVRGHLITVNNQDPFDSVFKPFRYRKILDVVKDTDFYVNFMNKPVHPLTIHEITSNIKNLADHKLNNKEKFTYTTKTGQLVYIPSVVIIDTLDVYIDTESMKLDDQS